MYNNFTKLLRLAISKALKDFKISFLFSFFLFLTILIYGSISIAGQKDEPIYFSPSIIVPVVASAKGGYGSDWRSDVWIYNSDYGKTAIIDLYFVPPGTSVNPDAPSARVNVGGGKTLYLEDIVQNKFHTQGLGVLFLTFPTQDENGVGITNVNPKKVVVESNVYNKVDENKQYGQQMPGIHIEELAQDGSTFYLPASPDPEKYRANLGIVTFNANKVLIRVRDNFGLVLYEKWHDLPQYSLTQFNDILSAFNIPPETWDPYVEIQGNGKIITYMSHVDKRTNDGSAFMGETLSQIEPDLWFPGIARASGAQGSEWRSSVFMINPNLVTAGPGIIYLPVGQGYDGIIGETARLEILEHKYWEDFLLNKYGLQEGLGGIVTRTIEDGSEKTFVWVRTYNNTPEGTFGQNIPFKGWHQHIKGPPLIVNPPYEQWDERGILTGVSHDERSRANLILQNTAIDRMDEWVGIDATCAIYDAEGHHLGEKTYSLIPGEYRQINRFVEDILGAGATLSNGTVSCWVPSPPFDNDTDPYNHTRGGLDVRISVVNGNVTEGTNDGRLITAYKINLRENPVDDPYDCKGDFLCEKAVEYVVRYYDGPCDPNNPPGMQYDPDGDGKCAPWGSYLSNQEVRSMIKGCDPQGSTGYVCGVQTGRSIPSYARRMAEILYRDPRLAEQGITFDYLLQWLYNGVDNDRSNGEFLYSWDPMLWQSYTAQGKEDDRVRFYVEPSAGGIDFFLPSLQDILEFYDLTKEYLVRTVTVNPEWYGGNATDGPNFDYDPTWRDQDPNN